jgi:hypothetical protein
VECDCGLIGFIRDTYPISFICWFGATFGALLNWIPASREIRILEQLLGIRKVKEK